MSGVFLSLGCTETRIGDAPEVSKKNPSWWDKNRQIVNPIIVSIVYAVLAILCAYGYFPIGSSLPHMYGAGLCTMGAFLFFILGAVSFAQTYLITVRKPAPKLRDIPIAETQAGQRGTIHREGDQIFLRCKV